MERLVAFEFISATDEIEQVRLKKTGEIFLQIGFRSWVGFNWIDSPLEFEKKEDLMIEGNGLGRPYWNEERPSWATVFVGTEEFKHINTIRAAIRRELNVVALHMD